MERYRYIDNVDVSWYPQEVYDHITRPTADPRTFLDSMNAPVNRDMNHVYKQDLREKYDSQDIMKANEDAYRQMQYDKLIWYLPDGNKIYQSAEWGFHYLWDQLQKIPTKVDKVLKSVPFNDIIKHAKDLPSLIEKFVDNADWWDTLKGVVDSKINSYRENKDRGGLTPEQFAMQRMQPYMFKLKQ